MHHEKVVKMVEICLPINGSLELPCRWYKQHPFLHGVRKLCSCTMHHVRNDSPMEDAARNLSMSVCN